MNPILAVGLIGMGGRLINNIMAPKTPEIPAEGFDNLLRGSEQVKPVGELATYLKVNKVSDFQGMEMVGRQLQNALLNHPHVAPQIADINPGHALSVKITDGSLITVESSEGMLTTLPKDSEAGQIALKLHQVNSILQEHKQLPGAEFSQLVSNAQSKPLLNASWVLRDGFAVI